MPELLNASPEEQLTELMILNWRSVMLVAVASSMRVILCSRMKILGNFDAVFEKLLDFCFRKLSRRDFGVTPSTNRSSFFS
jgi:hypothetical protein